jgi:hypothetical protein
VLVEVLNVLSLFTELLLDGHEPVYFVSMVLHCPIPILHVCFENAIGIGCSIEEGGFGDVLGFLFLTDVELFLGGLALGESVTGNFVRL